MLSLRLLSRHLSAYTDDDLILGVFRTEEKAMAARRIYIETIERDGDPHARQGYMTVDLQEDVRVNRESETLLLPTHMDPKVRLDGALERILPHELCGLIAEYMDLSIRFLARFINGMGQTYMQEWRLAFTRDQINVILQESEKIKDPGGYPEWWRQDELLVDQLRYENHYRSIRV